jgi:predicted nucleotidyltransferase
MKSVEIIKALRNDLPIMKSRFGVEKIGLFGSYARNEERENSDIDVLVKFREPALKSLIGLLDFLEAKFKRKVDIVTEGKQLSERFRAMIKSEIIYA